MTIILKIETRRIPFPEDRMEYKFQAEIGHCTGNKLPHFSVTGDGWDSRTRRHETCGCLHEALGKCHKRGLLDEKETIIAEVVKWHLCDLDGTPMHYVANTQYWWEQHLQHLGVLPPKKWYLAPRTDHEQAELAKSLDRFKSTSVFGTVEGDVLPEWDGVADHQHQEEKVKKWCEERLPALKAAFRYDMTRLFSPQEFNRVRRAWGLYGTAEETLQAVTP